MANPTHVLSSSLADRPDGMSLLLQFSTLSFLASPIPLSARRLTPVSTRCPLSEGELKRRFDRDHADNSRCATSGISASRQSQGPTTLYRRRHRAPHDRRRGVRRRPRRLVEVSRQTGICLAPAMASHRRPRSWCAIDRVERMTLR